MKAARYALFVYFVVVAAYVGYACYSYTGLYKLAAEWQMQLVGSYSSKLTFMVPLLILMIPAALVERIFGLGPKRARALAAFGSSRAPAAFSISPARIALIGVIALALAAGAGSLGYRKSLEQHSFESVDLGNNGKPASTHVVMTGLAQTAHILKFSTTIGGTTRVDTYVPLTPSNWRRGDPLVYFLKTNATVYMPPGAIKPLEYAPETPPFRMTTQPGVLLGNALPGPLAESYRKRGIAVAASPIVLDLDSDADVEPFFVAAGVAGLIGLCCLAAAAMAALQSRRVART